MTLTSTIPADTPRTRRGHAADTTPDTTLQLTGDMTAGAGREPRPPGRIWAYLGIVVGAVVSIAANVAHSFVPPPDWPHPTAGTWRPEVGAVLGAMFWPVALLITTEIMARTTWPPGRPWLLLRFAGLLPVAAVAGIVSYLHLHGLLQHYYEAPLTCLIAPFSVDGLMVMASSALVATGNTPPSDFTPATSSGEDRAAAGDSTPDPEHTPSDRLPTASRSATGREVARVSGQFPELSTADIAARLGVSARTVRRHLANRRGAVRR